MSECTDIFWRAFSERAGITLGPVMPLLLGVGAMMRAVFRRLPRHDERL